RLAQTDATVEEQRVVGAPWIFSHLERCGLGELVALAFDEGGESKIGIQPRADDQPFGTSATRRGDRSGHIVGTGARAHLHRDDRNVTGALIAQQLADPGQQIGIDPSDDEAVGGEQLERPGAFQYLQRAHPRIELLLGKLGFQGAHALSPMRRFHAWGLRDRLGTWEKGVRSLYLVTRMLKLSARRKY